MCINYRKLFFPFLWIDWRSLELVFVHTVTKVLSWWLRCKESAYNAGDLGPIPGLGRSPGEENGYPLQNSCLENPMDRGAWWATIHGVTKSQTQLSNWAYSGEPKKTSLTQGCLASISSKQWCQSFQCEQLSSCWWHWPGVEEEGQTWTR